VQLRSLWLTDFRNYTNAELDLAPGLTAIVGANGEGKSNLLEAIAYLATVRSFRGAPTDALVRREASSAVVRAQGTRDGRDVLLEAEIVPSGRSRVMVNRQRLARTRDLLGALRVTVFSPDDLVLVKGGPGERRGFLDDVLVSLQPRNDVLRSELERVLRQRNALLRQAGGRLSPDVETTLEVWNTKLVEVGETFADQRVRLIDEMRPLLNEAYADVAGRAVDIEVMYESAWRDEGLAVALENARIDELRRGVSLVGPHRDELAISIAGAPVRTHASQGEQRSLALALRLASHAVVERAVGEPPILLLDDVFSELDPGRCHALVEHLPKGQAVLTTASGLPPGAAPEQVVRVEGGQLSEVRGPDPAAGSDGGER
jgi:DNA replication and repair protein RecF